VGGGMNCGGEGREGGRDDLPRCRLGSHLRSGPGRSARMPAREGGREGGMSGGFDEREKEEGRKEAGKEGVPSC